MHLDARELENDTLIEGEICIMGAGAAGISMAMDLNGTAAKVILLEGGGFAYDDSVQDLYAGKTTGQPYYPLRATRLHYFGGTTGHWGGQCSPLDPIDFEARAWVPHSGWPIRFADLDPFYAKAQRFLDLGPYDYTHAFWQNRNSALAPLLADETAVWNKMWQFVPPMRLQFGKRLKLPLVRSSNVHLYTYANVVDIKTDPYFSGVVEVVVANGAGKRHRVRAKQFVLACCAIQNARMLLAANSQMTCGLGNQNDLVGRFFMEHIEIQSGELWLTKPDPLPLYAYSYGNTPARAELAITRTLQAERRILNGTVSLTPLEVAKSTRPMIELWDNADPRKSQDRLVRDEENLRHLKTNDPSAPLNRAYSLFTRLEQAPHRDSRVTLDRDRDELGVPRASLNWKFGALEKHSLRTIHRILGQQIGGSAVGRVKVLDYLVREDDESWPEFTGGGWHHMGTTRMSDDPRQGVVDRNCRVHGLDNLYVAGSSCFSTGGAANPTLSVVAISLRLADHLKSRLGSS